MTAGSRLGGIALGVFGASIALTIGAGIASAQTVNYGYDALGRLITVNRSNGTSATYAYDAAGNRSQVVMAGPSSTLAASDLGVPVSAISVAPAITGVTVPVAVSIVDGQYRINGAALTTANDTISADQTVQVQAPGAPSASQTATLTVSGVSDAFQVTASADATPNPVT